MAEAELRGPLERERVAVIQSPGPVHTAIDFIRIVADLAVVEVFAAGEHATKEDGHVDRRDFGNAVTIAGVDIHEVIEEAVYLMSLGQQETKRGTYARSDLFPGTILALVTDAERRQAEAGRCNATHQALVAAIRERTIAHETGIRIRFVPEEIEGRTFEVVQQRGIEFRTDGIFRQ